MRARVFPTLALAACLAAPVVALPELARAEEAAAAEEKTALSAVNEALFGVLFFDVTFGAVQVPDANRDGTPVIGPDGKAQRKTVKIPFLVTFLVLGATFFTLWFRFINVRGFGHALRVVRGDYDNPDDEGEISHFRALTSALSATVGLGNIAGVAVAIMTGGPGAVFWMSCAAVVGMSAKFSSCTLAQLYRQVNADGSISGGPMYYLDLGLKRAGMAGFGKVLGVMYAIMIMGGSLGGGNMFQANQTVESIVTTFGLSEGSKWGIGIVMAVMVAAVILGGIKRIGAATSKIVPAMCGIYVLAAIVVLLANISRVPEAFGLMIGMAFSKNAFFGGMMGVLVTGVQRAAFSNEAGMGSAAVAHAAAKTDEPVREGMVAMLGPFIDTIVVCNMTGIVVVVTGAWNDPAIIAQGSQGVSVTAAAFGSVLSWFPYVLTVCIVLFAYSTMISWCYYGERGWIYLMDHFGGAGLRSVVVFRVIFVLFVIVGAVNKLGDVLDFSDIMILSMAFPNILGSVFLAPRVREKLDDYWGRLQSGQMKTYAEEKSSGATSAA
jgi:AGCS family alanine or glycine:cation symporter